MTGRILTKKHRDKLLSKHRLERDRRVADRIKSVLLYDEHYSFYDIGKILFSSHETARRHVQEYLENHKLKPENGGSRSDLTDEQIQKLLSHLEDNLYDKVKNICEYAKAEYGVEYSVRGLTDLIKKHKFTFHKPAGVPAKADKNAQIDFIEKYENLKNNLHENDKIIFIDGVHPTHAVRFVRGWIRKGVRKEIPTNGSQKRMNILGAFDLKNMQIYTQDFATLNSTNFIIFLQYLLAQNQIGKINIILDRGGYQHCHAVWDFVKNHPQICLHYLPPYSPNLNVIERLWKILHEHTTNNVYHPNFKAFTEKINEFFSKTFEKNKVEWVTRLSDNFRATNSPLLAT